MAWRQRLGELRLTAGLSVGELLTDLGDVGEPAATGGLRQSELGGGRGLGEFDGGGGIGQQRELLRCGALGAGGGEDHGHH